MDPMIFACLLIGAMLPYAFSAFTMKSVGKAALEMVYIDFYYRLKKSEDN